MLHALIRADDTRRSLHLALIVAPRATFIYFRRYNVNH
jgi:hypothetical protein